MRLQASRFSAFIATGFLLAVAVVVAALVIVTGDSSGNSTASKSPEAIVTATEAAAADLRSGAATYSAAGGTRIDFHFVAGKGAWESISSGRLSYQVITIDNVVYSKGLSRELASAMHLSASAAAKVRGRWVQNPPEYGDRASDGLRASVRGLLTQMLAGHGTLTKGATTTVDGVKVVAVSEKGLGWTLYVARTGKPYPIEVIESAGRRVRVVFSEFNAPMSLRAPAHPVNITKLAEGF